MFVFGLFLGGLSSVLGGEARSYSDLEHVFSPSHVLFHTRDASTLRAAMKHEEAMQQQQQQLTHSLDDASADVMSMRVACTSYSSVRALESSLHKAVDGGAEAVHPVYFSRLNDKACYTFHATPATTAALAQDGVKVSVVPHALKIDSSVAWTSG